jgi:hypothetical protein
MIGMVLGKEPPSEIQALLAEKNHAQEAVFLHNS